MVSNFFRILFFKCTSYIVSMVWKKNPAELNIPFKGTILSRSEQPFNRAWNLCPSLRWTQWLTVTGSFMQQQRSYDLIMWGISPKKELSGFWSPRTSPQTGTSAFFCFFLFGLWNNVQLQPKLLDRLNSAVLCYKRLFQKGVLATILCTWEIWTPHIQCITYFPIGKKMAKKNGKKKKKKRSTAPILKPTDDQKPESFFFSLASF